MHTVSFVFLDVFTVITPILAGYYLLIAAKNPDEAQIKRRYVVFLSIAIVAIGVGAARGMAVKSAYLATDVMSIACLSLAVGANLGSGYLLRRKKVSQSLNIILLCPCFYVLFSSLFYESKGLSGSFLRGDSITVQYLIYFLGFYGLALVAEGRERLIGYGFVVISIVLSAHNFDKWTLPIPIIYVFCLSLFREGWMSKAKSRSNVLARIVIGILFFWAISQTPLPDMMAKRIGYQSFQDFWERRMINPMIPSKVPIIGVEVYIRSGGRFDLWEDIIYRTLEHPFVGIGIGERPSYFVNPLDIGPHNIFIFLLGSFGFPLFFLFLVTFFLVIRSIYQLTLHSRKLKVCFWGWLFYVLFAFSVGVIYESRVNLLFAFLPVSVFLRASQKNVTWPYLKA